MTNRMTGITGLIDTDALVTSTMKPYKLKVETQKQKLQTMQWQQEQYRTIMKDSKSFYDKYLDPDGSKSLSRPSKYTTTKFSSDKENIVTATTSDGAVADTYTVSVTQLASKATDSLSIPPAATSQTITIGTTGATSQIQFDASSDGAKTVANYNNAVSKRKSDLNNLIKGTVATEADKTVAKAELATLNSNAVTAKYSEFTKTVNFTANEMGKGGFKLASSATAATDKPLIATITNSKNVDYKILSTDNVMTNNKIIDGVTFNFNGTTAATEKATLTGKSDITNFKENIKSFVDDYNTLLTSINTKIYETRDKSYKPLSDDEKKDMSDTQIEKWEKKAQTGLLRKDGYLEDITRNMKDAMSTFMSSTGLDLEGIGVEPVKYEYTDKNGLLKINDEKLTKALETNFDGVKDLFIRGVTTNDAKNGGVITKLKVAIYSDTISPKDSELLQNVGTDTSYNSLTNEMSKNLTDMKKNIKQMEKDLTARENGLYTKYSKLESALSSLQSQQSSLSSYFGSN